MFSHSEMILLSKLGRGAVSISDLRETMGLGKVQIYRTVASLKEKGAVDLHNGNVFPQKHAYLYSLMNVIHDASAATDLLAGNGLRIITELREPRTTSELSRALGISKMTVSRSIKRMRNVSMLSKDGDRYSINAKIWPELVPLANRFADHYLSFDDRAPVGSRLYHRSEELVVFSNDRELDNTLTAFSVYPEHGIDIGNLTYYYCNIPDPLSRRQIFFHSLLIITEDKEWRMRMMALIYYKKYLEELKDIDHPMRMEMDKVLQTREGKVNGWVPLKEMQERAEIYGVNLYD